MIYKTTPEECVIACHNFVHGNMKLLVPFYIGIWSFLICSLCKCETGWIIIYLNVKFLFSCLYMKLFVVWFVWMWWYLCRFTTLLKCDIGCLTVFSLPTESQQNSLFLGGNVFGIICSYPIFKSTQGEQFSYLIYVAYYHKWNYYWF